MAENTVAAKLSVEVEARLGKLEQGLKKAEAKAKVSGKKIEKAVNKSGAGFTGITAGAMKAVSIMGTLELAVGAANVGFDLMKGDVEGAAEAIKLLPAGIGPFAKQLETLLNNITGIADEIEKLKVSLELGQKMVDFSADVLKSREMTVAASQAIVDKIGDEVELLGKSKKEQQAILDIRVQEKLAAGFADKEKAVALDEKQLEAQQKLQSTIKDLKKQYTELDSETEDYATKRAKLLADMTTAEGQLSVVVAEQEKARAKIRDDAVKGAEGLAKLQTAARIEAEKKITDALAAEKKKQVDNEAAEQERVADERISQADRMASLDSEIKQKQLEATGQQIEAELEAIREGYRSQIAEAERAGDTLLAAKLKLLRGMEVAEVKATDEQERRDKIEQARQEKLAKDKELAEQQAKERERVGSAAQVDRRDVAGIVTASSRDRKADALDRRARTIEASGNQRVATRDQGRQSDNARGDDIVKQLQETNNRLETLSRAIVGA